MMDGKLAVETIQQKFATSGHQITIPLQKGGSFKANIVHEGIMVSNLGNQPLLPWIVFEETINFLPNIMEELNEEMRWNTSSARKDYY
jgi:hypothetical protein